MLYNCYIKEININNLEKVNNLTKKTLDKKILC